MIPKPILQDPVIPTEPFHRPGITTDDFALTFQRLEAELERMRTLYRHAIEQAHDMRSTVKALMATLERECEDGLMHTASHQAMVSVRAAITKHGIVAAGGHL